MLTVLLDSGRKEMSISPRRTQLQSELSGHEMNPGFRDVR